MGGDRRWLSLRFCSANESAQGLTLRKAAAAAASERRPQNSLLRIHAQDGKGVQLQQVQGPVHSKFPQLEFVKRVG